LIVIFERHRSTRDGNHIRDGIVGFIIVGICIVSIKNFIICIVIGAVVAFDVGIIFIVGKGLRITVGIGVVAGVLGLTISLVDVGLTYGNCGRASGVDKDLRLAVKVEVWAGGRRTGWTVSGMAIGVVVGGRGVGWGVGRAYGGIIIAVGVFDGTFFVATVNAHRKD